VRKIDSGRLTLQSRYSRNNFHNYERFEICRDPESACGWTKIFIEDSQLVEDESES
jgi:hypothetical protein